MLESCSCKYFDNKLFQNTKKAPLPDVLLKDLFGCTNSNRSATVQVQGFQSHMCMNVKFISFYLAIEWCLSIVQQLRHCSGDFVRAHGKEIPKIKIKVTSLPMKK